MLISKVSGFEGPCKPVWINRNQVCIRLDGFITGFFRLGRWPFYKSKEFHGYIKGNEVFSTERMY